MIKFTATVSSRSTARLGGPPGEAKILELNPGRRQLLLGATGWGHIYPGSLNLEVVEDVICQLASCKPLVCEKADTIHYPEPYSRIPRLRDGYLYYFAVISRGNKEAAALMRRARNPIPTRIEAFSDRFLREHLGLTDGDQVICKVDDAPA